MKNPYVRLRELTGLGQREFERKYQLSHTVMSGIESGLFPDLSDYMIESLGRECAEKGVEAGRFLWNEYQQSNLQDAYHAWQTQMRKLAKPMVRFTELHSSATSSPMRFLVTENFGNPRSFCTTLKVPSATVMRYIVGATRTMPKVIEQALTEAGMSKKNLTTLKQAQEVWTDAGHHAA